MSRRRSTGDLVPRDITEILAREARVQRGQKKPGSSLGQAFSWLKGSKKKKSVGNGLNRNGAGVTDAKLGHQNQEPAKAGPKGNEYTKRLTVHYTSSQHYQENVFIEGSRPQHLENLHIEAQEGLKIQQQQEETKNGVNFPDDESIASTDTLRPEQEISSKDGGASPDSGSTTGNTDTTGTSSVSTRPVLTRQGSTFKPLNPVKRLDKSKKRSRRTTIMGIPNQVQKELALHRSSTFQPLESTQLSKGNDSQPGVVIIPTIDGGTLMAKKEGARVHLSEFETISDDQLVRKHLEKMSQDEQFLNHQGFGTHLCHAGMRPKSLAVPGMTTSSSITPSMFHFLQETQGPVMSISPQATYLSTIIPNAILPASIEVIEIDRSSSRTHSGSFNHSSSVRTVSKSSLTSGDSSISPLLSRRSDGDGSQNSSSQIPTSASGSNWSESSRTIKSNSSPVSSKASARSGNSQPPGVCVQEGKTEQGFVDQDHLSLCSSVSAISSSSGKHENTVTELGAPESACKKEHPKRNCTRSLSVMKTKQPPAPPRRTNSLHGNKIRGNAKVQVYSIDISDSNTGEVTTATENVSEEIKQLTKTDQDILTSVTKPTVSADSCSIALSPRQDASSEGGKVSEQPSEYGSSSPQKTLSEGGKFERTMSPSSGYSSQSGTPTHSPKGNSPTSPEKQKKTPVKPERSVSRASSSGASPSSSLTSLSSGTSELANTDVPVCNPNIPPNGSTHADTTKNSLLINNSSSFAKEITELLNIPPPPKVKAPCPPPPEAWAHNRRTFELLCASHTNIKSVSQKTAQQDDDTKEQTGNQTAPGKEMQVLDKSHTKPAKSVDEREDKTKHETLPAKHPDALYPEQTGEKSTRQEDPSIKDKEDPSVVISQEETCKSVVKEYGIQETTPKKEPPPVMKKPTVVLHREENWGGEQSSDSLQKLTSESPTSEIQLHVEDHTMSLQNDLTDRSEDDTNKSEAQPMQTLAIEAPKITKVSPPPTPPPAYHPTPPPSRKTPSSVSVRPNELQQVQEEMSGVESSWPPPPPPLEGDSAFDAADEVDFPPPPPPFLADIGQEMMNNSESQVDIPSGGTSDMPTVQLEPASPEDEPLVAELVSNANTHGDEVSSTAEQSVSLDPDRVSPILVESPPTSPATRAESPVSITAAGPQSTFLKLNSLKHEDHNPPSIPNNVQPPTVPLAPPLPAEALTHGVNFRRQPSVTHRDAKGKELLTRHKSAPIPKEDANIPLVTPSLLQMVRLRSVNMIDDLVNAPPQDVKPTEESTTVQESCVASVQGAQNIPQKPIRKSLSLKSPPQHVKTSSVTMSTPSMRLQEAIRLKTAAMSSRDSLSCRLGVRPPMYSCIGDPGALSLKSPDARDLHASPASAASFVFSRSTKKLVIEAAASTPEAQAALRQNLASELLLVSDQSRAPTFSNGGAKCEKIPPPVAKKPTSGSISPSQTRSSCVPAELSTEGNGATRQQKGGTTLPETTTRVTADTIETLF